MTHRTSTALVVYEIPGRARGDVRVHAPAPGKASFRVLWTDADGRQRERTRTSLEEAERLAETVAIGLASNQPVSPEADPTLGDLLVYHLDGPGRSPKWTSERSARRPAQIARRILAAEDLARPAREYTGPEGRVLLQGIMNRAAQKGCAPGGSEYAKAGGLLKTLFDIAARDDLMALPGGNPMNDVRYRLRQFSADPMPQLLTVNYIGPELRPPTERVHDFIDAAEAMFGRSEARYVEVLAFGGLRPGEANALGRAQVRTDHPGLLVNQQILELTASEAAASGGRTAQFRPPKWGHLRNAAYPREFLDRLIAHADSHAAGPGGVIFPNRSGTGFRSQGNWRRDVFNPVARHVGWPTEPVHVRGRDEVHWVWPVYAFRHHYANYLLKDLNISLVRVARCMGHRDARVTERMYLKTELHDLDMVSAAHEAQRLATPA